MSDTTDTPPKVTGEPRTGRQSPAGNAPIMGFLGANAPGYTPAPPGTWGTYRDILRHPTAVLAFYALSAPIMGGEWMYEKSMPSVPDAQKNFIQDVFDAHRPELCRGFLRGAAFGFQAWEMVLATVAASELPHTEGLPSTLVTVEAFKELLAENTEALFDDDTGAFLGARNKSTKRTVDLPAEQVLWYAHGKEGDNYYGAGLCENARLYWSQWLQTNNRAGQFGSKVAGVVPVILYPPGVSKMQGGAPRDNSDIAQDLLINLGLGKGFAVPNLSGNSDDPRMQAELAGKSQWIVTFLEVRTDFFAGFIAERKYLDAMIVRAFLGLERGLLESSLGGGLGGSDAKAHGDKETLNSELLHAEFLRALTQQPVDRLLVWNFGAKAKGNVKVSPAPLFDEKRQQLAGLAELMLQSPTMVPEASTWFNWDAILDGAGFPKSGAKISFNLDDLATSIGGLPPKDAPPTDVLDKTFDPTKPAAGQGT